MALIEEDQKVLGEVVEQGGRRFSGSPSGEVPGVVLDPVAVPHLDHHLEVEVSSFLDALGLEQLVLGAKELDPLLEFLVDLADGPFPDVHRGDIVGGGIDGHPIQFADRLARERVDLVDGLHEVAEEVDPNGSFLLVHRIDVHHIPANTEVSPGEVVISPLVLDLHQLFQHVFPGQGDASLDGEKHVVIGLGRPEAVDAGDARHDDHIVPVQQRTGGRVPHLVDLFVDVGVLGNVGVGLGDIGLGLIIVVVADKVLHGIVGKEPLQLTVELGCEGLVGGNDQGGLLHACDDVRHGEGLARAGDPKEDHVPQSLAQAVHQIFDGAGLIAAGLEIGDELKGAHGEVYLLEVR